MEEVQSNEFRALEPCPFCGGRNVKYCEDFRFHDKPFGFPKWYVLCVQCGVYTSTGNIETVTKMWNRRSERRNANESRCASAISN